MAVSIRRHKSAIAAKLHVGANALAVLTRPKLHILFKVARSGIKNKKKPTPIRKYTNIKPRIFAERREISKYVSSMAFKIG